MPGPRLSGGSGLSPLVSRKAYYSEIVEVISMVVGMCETVFVLVISDDVHWRALVFETVGL